MLTLVTKASNPFWYQFKTISTLEQILKIYPSTIIQPNIFTAEDFLDGLVNESDIPLFDEAKINIVIYDDYVE